MRNQPHRIHVVCLAIALSLLAPSLAKAQGALDKFGENILGAQDLERYAGDLSKVGEQLRPREIESQHASQAALTFLNLLRTARSDQEWKILAALRPGFNAAWRYLIDTGSLAGQQLQGSAFGKDLPRIYSQSKKIVDDPVAAAEYALGEALVVGPYGRSAGDIFRVRQLEKDIGDDDLVQLAEASKSGVVEKVEKAETKELGSNAEALFEIVSGIGTIGGDIIGVFNKSAGKSKVILILSVPQGVAQVVDGLKKLRG
jgi:hypothetical protein